MLQLLPSTYQFPYNFATIVYSFEQNYRRLQQELLAGGVALVGIFGLGTFWYRFVEQWSWSEAAYMTVITLSTVGFSEVHPLPQRSQLFTIALILLGIVNLGYIVNRFTEALIQGYFQEGIQIRQQKRLIESLSSHYILCGFGRIGQQIAREFKAESTPFIIIEEQPEQVNLAQQFGYLVMQGDATLDETLQGAKIEQAVCLVAALPSDAENLYTVLSAKTLNPSIRAIARAGTEEAIQKLQRAGADAVVSPHITGARRLAAAALRPQIMDFVDGILTGTDNSFYIEEFLLDPETCTCVGQTLKDARLRSRSGALVLAIRRADGTLVGGPRADIVLMPGDLLFCMGTADELRQLNRILYPDGGQPPRTPRSL